MDPAVYLWMLCHSYACYARRRSAVEPRQIFMALGMARKLKDCPDSPALDQNHKAPAKVPRLGGLRGSSRAHEILDLTGMGDSMNRCRTCGCIQTSQHDT